MYRKIQYLIRSFFGFSQIETNGFVLLLLILCIVLMLPALMMRTMPEITLSQSINLDIEVSRLDSLLQLSQQNNSPNHKDSLFAFDPNQMDKSSWMRLGLEESLAKRIENYVSKGGKFRIKSDLLKMYGFPEELYDKLEAFIQLPSATVKKNKRLDTLKNRNKFNNKKQQKNPIDDQEPNDINEPLDNYKTNEGNKKNIESAALTIDINTATSLELKRIKGVGEKLSTRIINYRDALGGFYDVEQFSEVYGLEGEALSNTVKSTVIDVSKIKKIKINQASYEELKKHPYIGGKNASALLNYKKKFGNFATLTDVEKALNFAEKDFVRLKAYILIE